MAGPADIIASSYPGVPILLDWRLRERAYGELETHQKEQAKFDKTFTDTRQSYHASEPLDHFTERVCRFIVDCKSFEAEVIVVVTHNGVLDRINYIMRGTVMHDKNPNGFGIKEYIDYDDARIKLQTTMP